MHIFSDFPFFPMLG